MLFVSIRFSVIPSLKELFTSYKLMKKDFNQHIPIFNFWVQSYIKFNFELLIVSSYNKQSTWISRIHFVEFNSIALPHSLLHFIQNTALILLSSSSLDPFTILINYLSLPSHQFSSFTFIYFFKYTFFKLILF